MAHDTTTFEQLVAYAAGELPAEQVPAVEALVKRDPAAAETVRLFRLVREIARADWSVDPPASVLAAAKALYRERPVAPGLLARFADALTRVVAALAFDSRAQPAYAGLRGGSDAYQLTFECAVGEVDLEVGPLGSGTLRRAIRGQLALAEPAQMATVALSEPGRFEPLDAVDVDASGMFALTATCGRYDILVSTGERVVVLPNVEIQ